MIVSQKFTSVIHDWKHDEDEVVVGWLGHKKLSLCH